MTDKPLATIVIPKFITKVQMSKKRRKKYWKQKSKDKWYPRALPTTYQDKIDNGDWTIDKKGYLKLEDGKKKIANPQAAGTPKYEVLSGNKLLSGYGHHSIRATLVNALRDFYRPFVKKHFKEFGPITQFPLRVTWDCYTTVEEDPNWDAGNLFFYYKYFEDALHKDKNISIIPEDSVKYITHPANPKIIPVDNWEDRKFEFNFYYDDRKELKRKPWL